MAAIGNFYRNGGGLAADPQSALRWHAKAEDAGLTLPQTTIGAIVCSGQGAAKDCAAARPWFEKAAAGGTDVALGWLISNEDRPAAR